jgi:hypothetical protein
MRSNLGTRLGAVLAIAAAPLFLAGCGDGKRSAEAETPISEAEVATDLPEDAISDQDLQAMANAAADQAAEVPSAGPGAAAADAAAPDTRAGQTVTTGNQTR